MPFSGEHSCRLIPPGEFSEFRRQNNFRQIDGKRVDAIFGIRDGEAELQAIRYPKNVWTSADARSHCSAQDGILFEPASQPQIREERMAHKSKFIRPEEIKILDKANGRISAVVSTESVDRDGDIIRQANWDLDHFKSHPILLSSHNYRGLQNQIGEWTDMRVEGNKLVGDAQYYIKQGNPEADWAFVLASKGRAAFSVGFVPDMSKAKQIEAAGNLSYEFQGQELLEVSQVTVPSNADALQSLKSYGVHPDMDILIDDVIELQRDMEGYAPKKPKKSIEDDLYDPSPGLVIRFASREEELKYIAHEIAQELKDDILAIVDNAPYAVDPVEAIGEPAQTPDLDEMIKEIVQTRIGGRNGR